MSSVTSTGVPFSSSSAMTGATTVNVTLTPASIASSPAPGSVTSISTIAVTPVVAQSIKPVTSVSAADRLLHASVNADGGAQVLNKQRLQDLVREVDPNEQLDDDVEELLLQIADDFIENVVTTSCMLAKHRKSSSLDVKDVQLSLEKNWNMWIPGFGSEELRPYRKSSTTEAHKQRMALIRKTLKKY